MNQSSQVFLLDANVFIEAHRRYYSFDICPGGGWLVDLFRKSARTHCCYP